MNGQLALQLRDLSMWFPSKQRKPQCVLDGITLDVQRGEFLSIIGPSGCGKTTLLQLISALVEPTGGEITHHPPAQVALVFQKPTLMPWRTCLDNATFGMEAMGHDKAAAKRLARRLLERMRLGSHTEHYPHQLSEGMKQRVNLARALLVTPDILLLDEPFSALDITTRRQLQDDLIELWRERRFTVILVSHALEDVVYMADRIVILSRKPTRIKELMHIDLPRPRRSSPAAIGELFESVHALEALMNS